jgi:hypothetical protein
MMAQIRDCGDGIRDGTYTMTAPKITGGTITGSTINNSAIGGTTAAAGAFTTLSATGVTTVQAGTVSLPAITTTGDTNTGIFFPAADTIAFTEGGVESMRIDSSGRVGIGTSSPAVPLAVYKASDSAINVQNSESGVNNVDGLQLLLSGANGYMWNYENGASIFGTNNTERMRIDSSGNVRIQTSGSLMFSEGTTAAWKIDSNGASGYLRFFDSFNNTERVRIEATGDFLVGQSSASNITAGTRLEPAGRWVVVRGSSTTSETIAAFYRTDGAGSAVGTITTTNTTTLYNSLSDYRLKTVVASISDAGSRIDALQPVEYDWKAGGRTRGFLAHQFAEVYPSSVSGEKDAVDKEGKPFYQSMQASSPEVMADLIAEIQSLRKRVAQLESK